MSADSDCSLPVQQDLEVLHVVRRFDLSFYRVQAPTPLVLPVGPSRESS